MLTKFCANNTKRYHDTFKKKEKSSCYDVEQTKKNIDIKL